MEALLRWYRPRRTAYPWRGADPYGVWVSEVMLQQTQAARVAPAYEAFVERFPGVAELAAASPAEVLRAWGNLGYPRRAVALSEAARAMVRDHGGRVPADPAVLRTLPGFGPYTAAAVAALGYGRPVAALDVNVRRVTARTLLGVEPHRAPAPEVEIAAERWLSPRAPEPEEPKAKEPRKPARYSAPRLGARPGDVLQALMDLGRTVCRPAPRCPECPLSAGCRFHLDGASPERRPRRQPAYAGSLREVRGAVLRALRAASPRTIAGLATETGFPPERLGAAVAGLAADRVVVAGDAATAGRPRGRVALPD